MPPLSGIKSVALLDETLNIARLIASIKGLPRQDVIKELDQQIDSLMKEKKRLEQNEKILANYLNMRNEQDNLEKKKVALEKEYTTAQKFFEASEQSEPLKKQLKDLVQQKEHTCYSTKKYACKYRTICWKRK